MKRLLARSPVYTIVSILTLALGIGATTATFTVVGDVLLKPLPFAKPDQLIGVYSVDGHGDTAAMSYLDFEDAHRRADVFSGFAFITARSLTYRIAGTSGLQSTMAIMVSEDFFPLIKARPVLGRLFTTDDSRGGATPVAVLSHDIWLRVFGASRQVIGETIDLGTTGQYTIVGVLNAGQAYPPGWGDAHGNKIYVPLSTVPFMHQGGMSVRSSHSDARTLARLKDGVTQAQATRELQQIAGQLAAAYPEDSVLHSATVLPLRNEIVSGIGPSFTLLAVAVLFVLLLACADVANLALVRATGRERELAMLTALGAGRARIVRMLLAESGFIAAVGGILGVGFAVVAVRAVVAAQPDNIPRLDELMVDWRSLVVAVIASAACAMLCALAPIAVVGRGDLVSVLKSGGRGASAGRRGLRLRGAIVAAQVALSVVLVSGAGLLIRSFALLRSVNPGFDAAHLAVVLIDKPRNRFADSASNQQLMHRVLDGLRLPGVVSASVINHSPMNGGATITPVGPDGRDLAADSVGAVYGITGPHYFATMGIPLIRGRDFTDADMDAGAVPAIVSATAAKRFWPNEDPIGHEMTVQNSVHATAGFGTPIRTTVIGVASDVKKFSLDEKPFPAVYLPITHPATAGGEFVVRTAGPPSAMIEPLRRAVRAVDPDVVVKDIFTGETEIVSSTATQQFVMTLLSVFSGLALVLASLGLYGVVTYAVTQRTSEIGVRVALGAQTTHIVGLVARGATLLVGTGLLIGTFASLLLARTMRSLLYGIGPNDPVTLISAAAVLGIVALVASYLPARRATRVDPIVALRAD